MSSSIHIDILHEMWPDPPWELARRVERVNQLAAIAGGRLISRQVIAAIIEQYERDRN